MAALDVPAAKLRLPSGEAIEFCYTNARLGSPLLDNAKPVKIVQRITIMLVFKAIRSRKWTHFPSGMSTARHYLQSTASSQF